MLTNSIRTAADVEAELATDQEALDFGDELDADDAADNGEAAVAALAAEAANTAAVAEASRKGWVPREQFKGPADKWVDAKTFVERGERFNVNLQREVQQLKEQIASFEGTKKAFAKFHEETVAKKDTEMAEAIASLRSQRSAAIREGDDDGAVALEDRIDLLKEQRKELAEPVKQEAVPTAPVVGASLIMEEWIADGNQWFQDEPKLRDYAIAIGDQMMKDGETVRGRKFLDLVAAKMAEEFPRRFRAMEKAAPLLNAWKGRGIQVWPEVLQRLSATCLRKIGH